MQLLVVAYNIFCEINVAPKELIKENKYRHENNAKLFAFQGEKG